jgi:hypothetical protein
MAQSESGTPIRLLCFGLFVVHVYCIDFLFFNVAFCGLLIGFFVAASVTEYSSICIVYFPCSGQTPTDPPITAELLEDWLHPLSHAELVAMVIRIGLTVPQASQTIMDLILHQQKRKIFVCRLSPDTTSSSLHQAFSQYGTVSEGLTCLDCTSQRSLKTQQTFFFFCISFFTAVVIQDSRSKRSRGFGFVKFADTASAERALQSPFKCTSVFVCFSFCFFVSGQLEMIYFATFFCLVQSSTVGRPSRRQR